jgi:LCP family protein required for cell wall assembly
MRTQFTVEHEFEDDGKANMKDTTYYWDPNFQDSSDPLAETQPTNQLTQLYRPKPVRPTNQGTKKAKYLQLGCFSIILGFVGLAVLIAAYLFFPGRTNILILGVDDRQEGQSVGRSDTMILSSFKPLQGEITLLSIPRDLWVNVPGYGENRINTAHFFAEADSPGAGSQAASQVVEENFAIDVDHVVRFRFDSFLTVIDSFGGLDIYLDEPMSGYPAGTNALNPEQALAFVRDREGSDDFFRMERGQIFIKSVFRELLSVEGITKIPVVFSRLMQAIDTDVPIYLWPRLGFNLLRAGPEGIDSSTISREMVTPFVTSGGAQVLAPNWEMIRPFVEELFGQ